MARTIRAAGDRIGLLSERIDPDEYGEGYYFATDVDGGTVYYSDGIATWRRATPGADAINPVGLSGSASGGRFVGATTSGAPVSGTYLVGDYIVDRGSGNIWVCTVAGSPGTWIPAGSGRELGYAEITANFTKAVAGSGQEDVTGLSINVTVGARPVYLHFWCAQISADTNPTVAIVLITDSGNTTKASSNVTVANPTTLAAGQLPVQVWRRVPDAPGSYTYKVRLNTNTGGAKPTIVAAATSPAFLRAVEA